MKRPRTEAFPVMLPDELRKGLPAGVTLYSRPEGRRWVMKFAPEWKQKTLPPEIVTSASAVAFVMAYLREKNLKPGDALDSARGKGPTVADCIDRWLPMLDADERCEPATYAAMRGHLNNHLRPALGTVVIGAFDVLLARNWVRDLRTVGRAAGDERRKIAPRTVLHIVSTARGLYDTARGPDQWVVAPDNPFNHPAVLKELPETPDTMPVCLPLATVQALLDFAGASLENRARYALAFTSGLRDGEIAAIHLDRLMLDGLLPTVEIVTSIAFVGKKGGGGWAKEKSTKTKSSVRILPLHHAAVAAIREWLTVGWPRLVKRQPKYDDFLFPRPDGKATRPRSAEFLRDDLRWAKLPTIVDGEIVTFKAARSTFASWLTEAEVPEAAIRRLLGHAKKGVTEKHYTVRDLGPLQVAVEKVRLDWHGTDGAMPPDVPAVQPIDRATAALAAELVRLRSELAAAHRQLEARHPRGEPGPAPRAQPRRRGKPGPRPGYRPPVRSAQKGGLAPVASEGAPSEA